MKSQRISVYASSLALSFGLSTSADAQMPQTPNRYPAPAVMLAQNYQQQAVKNWLASEKLDGVRAYWDGKTLYSRTGNAFNPPQAWLAALPPFALDGELYLGRGRFQETLSHIRQQNWQEIEYHIFDLPNAQGGLLERLQHFRLWLAQNPHPQLHLVEQIVLQDFAHAQNLKNEIEAAGGEGLILRDPHAPYLATRSNAMLKLKSHDDAECTVIGYLSGKGKHQTRMGALLCRLDDGRIIRIGSGFSDAQRENPPPLNTRISFRYRGLTNKGLPRFATFWRIYQE